MNRIFRLTIVEERAENNFQLTWHVYKLSLFYGERVITTKIRTSKKKVDQKFEKDQNVESLFKIDQNVKSFGSFPTQNLFDALILLMGLRMIRMLKV